MLTEKERHAPSLQVQADRRKKLNEYLIRKQKQEHKQGTPREMYKPLGEVVDDVKIANKPQQQAGFFKSAASKLNKAISSMGHRRKV